jgi:hypothetical protein
MTNFQRDLIRYLETTKYEGYDSVAAAFMCREVDWLSNPEIKEWMAKYDYLADLFKSWKNMATDFELVASHGGEGQGDEYWSVYKFTDNVSGEQVFIKFDGWYQSYNGAEYEGLSVVQPKEKLVTFYE